MRRLLTRIPAVDLEQLDDGLRRYMEGGLAIESDGAIIAVAARPTNPLPDQLRGDTVAIETWCNKIHVDDWCTEQLASSPVEEKLAHALVLANCVDTLAIQRGVSVAVIISIDTDDVVFLFHGQRGGDFPGPPTSTDMQSRF